MIESKLSQTNNHPPLREVVHEMFLSVAPERRDELEQYWTEFSPQFRIEPDDGPDGPLVMDAGGFVNIRFNHRIMRLFWLSSFAFLEGYACYHRLVTSGTGDFTRFREILDCFEATRTAEDVDSVPWPVGLPPPGELVEHKAGEVARPGGEVAIFGVSWALLHELRHLIHQQEGTSATLGDTDACRLEELDCDGFAAEMLLERISEFPTKSEHDAGVVLAKRQTGIYCALFALTLLSRGNWGPGAQHPATQDRIDHALSTMDKQEVSKVAASMAVAAFRALKEAIPGAPDPEESIGAIAARDGWSGDDELF